MKKTKQTKTGSIKEIYKKNEGLLAKEYRPLSAWNYFGRGVLYAIPVIGWIFLLVHAISCKNRHGRSFARSYFCALLVIIIVGAIVFALNPATPQTPEETTPLETTTPEKNPPSAPSVFDGIAFSDPAVVIPAAYALGADESLEGTQTLKGKIISSDGYNETYGDISVTIVVDGYENYPIYCYQIKKDADKIQVGDYIAVQGTLKNYKGSKVEFERPTLLAYEKAKIDENSYKEMSIAEARNAEKGAKVKVTGVVAQITYASGMAPNGIYLVDSTNSIYVYNNEVATSVAVGNTITIVAEKDWWILEDEAISAEKQGYKGCNQLTKARVIENDKKVSKPDYSWVKESTVKEILDTPFTTDITTTIYKVTALVRKQEGTGFFNFYIDDLDGMTGSYIYTQCNGNDLNWLEPFNGKICTVYLSVINAKSAATGCNWRFKAIEVIDEGFTFNTANAPSFSIDYFALPQFEEKYTADPALELTTSVSSELLGFEGVTLSYSSNNTNIVYFETVNGKTVMHCGNSFGKATVTITATYGENTTTKTVVVEHVQSQNFEFISVADAIATADDETVIVKGIVGPSVVNKSGFYLFGEDGSMIAVLVKDATQFVGLNVGNEIIISGKREQYVDESKKGTIHGQSSIVDVEILANYYGNHAYSTEKFITNATIKDVSNLDKAEDHSTEVYVLTGKLNIPSSSRETVSLTDADGGELKFYHSSPSQYSFLSAYNGQEVTIEVSPCNWNNKNYWRGCILAIRLPDGTKIVNQLNFN